MNTFRVALFLITSLLFAGCIELLEEVWINADGSSRIKIDFGMSEAMMSMGKSETGEDPFADLDQEFRKTKEEVEKNPKVKRIDFQQYSDGSLKHFVFDIEVTDFNELNAIPKLIYTEEDSGKKTTSNKMMPLEDSELRIERQSDGKILFVRKFGQPVEGEAAETDTSDKTFEEMGEAMAGAMFGNYHYTVRLHAEKIVSSNGKIDDVKKSVEWKFPIGQLMAGGRSFNKELRAEIAPPAGNKLMWIIAGVLAVGILAGLIARMRKKRPVEVSQQS